MCPAKPFSPKGAKPRRIQLSRLKGWRKPPNTVVVSRPSKWGNPFRVDSDHTKAECVAMFDKWFKSTPKGFAMACAAQKELRGRNLACWCRTGTPCHADILLAAANAAA
jgi:hypothetical protein